MRDLIIKGFFRVKNALKWVITSYKQVFKWLIRKWVSTIKESYSDLKQGRYLKGFTKGGCWLGVNILIVLWLLNSILVGTAIFIYAGPWALLGYILCRLVGVCPI